ncbi:plasmid stabilization protein [Iodidimonas gelatinilytica]|uniref:Plasmid stabilization protein n=1 Tax=Iodidimonas gelatinilytica TaxID=1236966 RepID=A0A5A7MT36_9PROT|nr:type II toxin-antitoxin system RelE/ParE family toxin [Iodidimonas gelatinilytica]GEQ99202.1 plasmid stabilization protein [Iodidimonas gelatinilytica]
MYEIAYSKKALNDLRRIPANERRRIQAKIADYASDPTAHAHHVKKLKGREGYRLRVGKWRVIFDLEGHVLEVYEVGARGSIYE